MIVFVTYENYPDGSPGAIRCASLAESYVGLGYRVCVLHKGNTCSSTLDNPYIIPLYEKNKYKKYLFFSKKVLNHLDVLIKTDSIEVVITYGVFRKINNWCKEHKIRCVTDVVEWYSKEQFKYWYFSYPYFSKNRDIHYLAKNKSAVICISSFLKDYFQSNGCQAVRIPILCQNCILNIEQDINIDTIKLVYAGSHILMDNIPLVVKSLARLNDDELKRISFVIYGFTEKALYSFLTKEEIKKTYNCLKIMGRRPNKEILEAYRNSNFLVLIRNPLYRVNKAGFPSKVIESMRMGVPILGNYSSDLQDYLIDKENSIIIKEFSETGITDALRSLLNITTEEMFILRSNAIKTVKDKFHPRAFKSQLLDIIYK